MNNELATELFQSGKAHSWSSCLLYGASIDHAAREGFEDPQTFAFNGTPSLSIHYLLGLGLELMLKSAIVAWDTKADVDAKFLRDKIGHDLVAAFDEAEERGFQSKAPHLRALVEMMCEPYKRHSFRYERPEEVPLPGDFVQVEDTLKVLDSELETKLQANAKA